MPRGRPDFSIYAYTDIYAQTIDKLKVDIVAQTISELVARISAGLVTIDRGVIVDMGRAIGGTLVITYYPILDTLTRTWVNAGEFGGGHSGSWVSRYKVVRDVDLVGHGYFAVMIAVHNTNTSVGLVADVTIDVALADYDSSTDTSTNIVTDSWTFKADVAAGGVEYYWFVRSFNITDRYTIPADHEIEYFIAWDTSEYDFDIYVNQENSDKPTSIGIPFDITRYGYA